MPLYPYACACGQKFERLRPATSRVGTSKCPKCKKDAPQDYQAKIPQIGMIDGPTVGYYPPEAGPYVNPGKSLLREVKSKRHWKETVKKSEGRIGDIS